MSAAEKAYEAARRLIAEAKREGASRLSFDFKKYRALENLPPEIADLSALEALYLGNV